MAVIDAGPITTGASALAGTLIALFLARFLPAYVGEKAKNLATKEDIGDITRTVESVRLEHSERLQSLVHQNQQLLESASRTHSLRLAALDKRLEAHQYAYWLWRRLLKAAHQQGDATITECQEWWERNCLYLEPASREAFRRAYHAAATHPRLVEWRDASVEGNWDLIVAAGALLVQSVELPAIAEVDTGVPRQAS